MATGDLSPVTPASAIAIAASGWDMAAWAERVRAADLGRQVYLVPEIAEPEAVGYALVWKPPAGFFRTLPNLRAMFSLGAGVDHLVFRDDLPAVPIVRVVNPDLTQRMTEWVTLQVLMHHRRQREYDALQRARQWQELAVPAAADVRVGIMGMGVLGRDAAAVLARLGYQVAGWRRGSSDVPGVRTYHGGGELDAFLARTDILVSLLPLTAETRGILSLPLFEKLARGGALGGAVLINAGRGGSQVEADIVTALERGVLTGVSLDVFEHEPLDPASPLWTRDDAILTPHVAAWSDPGPLAEAIVAQIKAFETGAPLVNTIDRAAGY
jgi:glyoxylate/hydroxypyruvate reductase A